MKKITAKNILPIIFGVVAVVLLLIVIIPYVSGEYSNVCNSIENAELEYNRLLADGVDSDYAFDTYFDMVAPYYNMRSVIENRSRIFGVLSFISFAITVLSIYLSKKKVKRDTDLQNEII